MASFVKIVAFITLISVCSYEINAQIKTSGIKTHYPTQNSGSLVAFNTTENYYGNSVNSYNYSEGRSYNEQNVNSNVNSYYGGGRNFIPAETYQGGAIPNRPSAPIVLDPIAEFINKTRSTMESGICYLEVPTNTLVKDASLMPIGNGTTPNMSKIQTCCEGYQRNAHVFARCEPICEDDCPNGICTAPGKCVCIPGHIKNGVGKCITTCPIGCGNGVCDEHGECQCKPGYTLDTVSRKYCVPQCNPECQFGECVAPNKCACREGYQATAVGVCEPKCEKCFNGQCVAPGICKCNVGYKKLVEECEPVCALGCENGFCKAPDTCECSYGFILDRSGSTCIPHCDQPCLNGVCVGQNTCKCNTGYIQDDIQKNICMPHCPQGCPNGYCTSPNLCICRPGFTKSGVKGRLTCNPI